VACAGVAGLGVALPGAGSPQSRGLDASRVCAPLGGAQVQLKHNKRKSEAIRKLLSAEAAAGGDAAAAQAAAEGLLDDEDDDL
jgi:hypothetical protein